MILKPLGCLHGKGNRVDEHWDNVVYLMPFSSDFIDVKTGTAANAVGSATITDEVQFDGSNCCKISTSSDYVDLTVGSLVVNQAFTVEGYVYPLTFGSTEMCIRTSYNDSRFINIEINSTGVFGIYFRSTGRYYTSANHFNLNQWNHFALTCVGGATRYYYAFLNGVLQFSRNSGDSGSTSIGSRYRMGRDDVSSRYLRGYMSNYRVTNGVARYTTDFTPSFKAFPTMGA